MDKRVLSAEEKALLQAIYYLLGSAKAMKELEEEAKQKTK